MENTKQIEAAIKIIEEKKLAFIVRHFRGYIIMAQSENDYQSKVNSINRGDAIGFYTVERALSL